MRKRNPMARDLRVNPLYRPRKGKSLRDQEGRADRWSRAAKHKPPKGTPGSAHGPGGFVRKFTCFLNEATHYRPYVDKPFRRSGRRNVRTARIVVGLAHHFESGLWAKRGLKLDATQISGTP